MGFLFIYLFFIPLWCWNTISNVEKDINFGGLLEKEMVPEFGIFDGSLL